MSRPLAPAEIIDVQHYERHGYPHDAWRRLRRETPVAWCQTPGYPGFWAITKHADVIALSKEPMRFQSAPIMAIFPREQYDPENFPFHHLLNMDPPEHRTYRALLASHFTPRAIEAKRARVEAVVSDCLARLEGARAVEFVAELSSVVPIVVIAEMLGIPEADRQRFFHWTNLIIAGTDPEYQQGESTTEATERGMRELFAYFGGMVEERRRTPTDDLTSLLANAKLDGAPMAEWELMSYLALVVVAGNETTRNAATGGLLALLEHPDELARLRAQPELLRSAVEEMVRWTTPVNQFCRTPVRDLELRGVRIPAGEPVCLFYASANRDEEVFADPFAFRVDRRPNPHLGFGVGEHVCMGAHLARLELQALFGALLSRLDEVALDGPVARQRSSFVGGIKRLPVRWRLRPGARGAGRAVA
jgi:cholest-4-en-3-one 26-monooxygenase